MKKVLVKIFIIIFLLAAQVFPGQVLASGPPPPPPPGSEGDQPPGPTAPIGGGLLILIALASGYGLKRLYDARKKLDE